MLLTVTTTSQNVKELVDAVNPEFLSDLYNRREGKKIGGFQMTIQNTSGVDVYIEGGAIDATTTDSVLVADGQTYTCVDRPQDLSLIVGAGTADVRFI